MNIKRVLLFPAAIVLVVLVTFVNTKPVGAVGIEYVSTTEELNNLVNGNYLALFENNKRISDGFYSMQRARLIFEMKEEFKHFKSKIKAAKKDRERFQKELSKLEKLKLDPEKIEARRKFLHCQIYRAGRVLQNAWFDKERLKIKWQGRLIKLQLLKWPEEKEKLQKEISEGKYADFLALYKNIGFRKMYGNELDDWRYGQKNLAQFYHSVHYIEDRELDAYANDINRLLVENSDLSVLPPEKIIFTSEINAMSIAGGFTFATSGFILSIPDGDASVYVGVKGHELAHIAARHERRWENYYAWMSFAGDQIVDNILLALFLADKIDYWTYWRLSYYGKIPVRFTVFLEALRKSRAFESQADFLGAIYAYKAGYDPRGFVKFFDIVNSIYGDHPGISRIFWTHPPSVSRMMVVFRTWVLLDKLVGRKDLKTSTTEFRRFQSRLREIVDASNPLDQQFGMWRPPVWHKPPPEGCDCSDLERR